MQRSPTDRIEFRTVRGLLIGDTLLRDMPAGETGSELVGFEEPAAQREWVILIYRDETGELTAASVMDRAQFKPGDFSAL
jgi:hypothetical protein